MSGRERDPASDDEFTDASVNLSVDLGTLEGSASATISQVPGDQDDKDTDDDDPNAEPDPDEQASYTVSFSATVTPAVNIVSADVRGNTILLELSPEGATGTLTLTLKGPDGAAKEIYTGVASGGQVQPTFHWDEFTPTDGEMTLSHVEASWDVGTPAAAARGGLTMARKSKGAKGKVAMKPRVESDFWNITEYFTPVLEDYPADELITIGTGIFDEKNNVWSNLHDEQYPASFVNSLRERNEGLGLSNGNVVRFRESHGQKGGTPYKRRFYIANPDAEQTGSCPPDHNIIGTTDTIASRHKTLRCGARVLIDGIEGEKNQARPRKVPKIREAD